MKEIINIDKLNPYQQEAVLDESSACIVNACVGSGKTTVLIAKILYLHYEKHVSYRDMVVLTFTNKAAGEIKERLIQADPQIDEKELTEFGTFHSVALQRLREALAQAGNGSGISNGDIGYTRDFFVIDPDEEVDMALQIIGEQKLKVKYKNRLKKRLEAEKGVNPGKAVRYQDDFPRLAEMLEQVKREQNKMAFSDLLYHGRKFAEESDTKPAWVIVDEVQDSDRMQLDFIDALMGENTRLFAVGDPNQVIYSWRGSDLSVVYTLQKRYQARELSLPINYRSGGFILEAAKKFQQNSGNLTAVKENGSKIVLRNHYNPFQEAGYLADRIRELHGEGVPYREIAIFYRLQEQSKVFEDVFGREEVPFEVSLKKTVQDIPVLNWLIKLLRYAVNPGDETSGYFVIRDKEYGLGLTPAKAKEAMIQKESSAYPLLERMRNFQEECRMIKSVRELYSYFELDQYLRPNSAAYQTDQEAVYQLLDRIDTYIAENKRPIAEGMREFINSSALYGIQILKAEISGERDRVKLMTLHAAKGLEFSHVFITGVNRGLIPLQARSFEEEEEERRLFFVGLTRAKDYLELSWYTDPGQYRAAPGESPYLKRIPEHLIQNHAVQAQEVDLQALKRQVLEEKRAAAQREDVSEDAEVSEVGAAVSVGAHGDGADENAAIPDLLKEDIHNQKQEERQQVRHKKYGVGTVLREDEMMVEVNFENYGVKEFMKMFSELEYLNEGSEK